MVIVYRHCSKIGCSQPAVATLTYSHADQTAVLGPLSLQAEPHTYDLCLAHADRLTAPRGWEIVRLELPAPAVDPQGLSAVMDAVNTPEPVEEELPSPSPRTRSWLKPLSQQLGPTEVTVESREDAPMGRFGNVRPFRRAPRPGGTASTTETGDAQDSFDAEHDPS